MSAGTQQKVFDSDNHRCVICGVGAGESYPDQPMWKARLTVGHFVADSLHGANDPVNLRTECSRCNEPSRELVQRTESAVEIWPKMQGLPRAKKARLLTWINEGQRSRDEIDRLFDQYRALPALQRDEIKVKLHRAVK